MPQRHAISLGGSTVGEGKKRCVSTPKTKQQRRQSTSTDNITSHHITKQAIKNNKNQNDKQYSTAYLYRKTTENKINKIHYIMGNDDAVDEEKLTLCCALCCINCSTYPSFALCSGKVGVCCMNCEVCCKTGAPCLPCCCCGPTCDGSGCCNGQCQICCIVISAAFPCTDEVPAALTILGCTIYPKCGPCMPMKNIMNRD